MQSDDPAHSVRRMIERRTLKELLESRDVNFAKLSRELGKSNSYVSELLSGKNKKDISEELLWQISQYGNIDPLLLGLNPDRATTSHTPEPRRLEEETEPYVPGPGDIISKPPAHVSLIRARSNALDEHREHILPGDICAFDTTIVDFAKVRDGDIVCVERMDPLDLIVQKGAIMRQYIAPNKLTTNSSGQNEIVSMDSPHRRFDYVLRGVLLYKLSGAALRR